MMGTRWPSEEYEAYTPQPKVLDDVERERRIREFVSPADSVTDRVFLLRLLDEARLKIQSLENERDKARQDLMDLLERIDARD